jgi:acyl-CoA hydrolase
MSDTVTDSRTDSRAAAIERAVNAVFATSGTVVIAAPLGLGKSNALLNAIYARALASGRPLHLATALSLNPPRPSSDIERRFLGPFLARHFGADYPRLAYADDRQRGTLPANVTIEEFYLQSGALLRNAHAQRHYNSLNYTHVARALAERGVTAVVQLVARDPHSRRLSLSCNPDLTLDLFDEIAALGQPRPLLLAEVHPDLPFMDGTAALDAASFDHVIEPSTPAHQLFALPRKPVSDPEYAIGFLASTLVRDGGSLQIGIGALSDALTHALVMRHTRNADYRRIVHALWPEVESSPLVCRWGGLGEFETGLFGASEMVMDGFQHLIEAGVVRRRVIDDVELMQRVHDRVETAADRERLASEGQLLHGGFFLGSKALYAWMRDLSPARRAQIRMTRISHINELYGGQEALERLQRREARFFNTCMMTSVLGAAVSDALDDGRVVSGVGGQYNFVAMAHALRESRSALMFRAWRHSAGGAVSNVVSGYGHATIPRHLRDIAITEYGIADLRGRCDEDCVLAMLAIADERFVPGLAARAINSGKLGAAPQASGWNTPQRLGATLAPFRRDGLLPDYPLGSDFTEVEQRLVRALGWLRRATATRRGKLATIAKALLRGAPDDTAALQRMELAAPRGIGERLYARLVRLALQESRQGWAGDD